MASFARGASIKNLPVLYEDNHLLVVNKPPLLATMGAKPGQPSVHALAADYLKKKYNKPGNVFVGIVSRLDAAASGVLVLARTSKAARRLSEQIRHRTTTKDYLAVVQGRLPTSSNFRTVVHHLKKCDSEHRMKVCGEKDAGSHYARLDYRCILTRDTRSVIAVRLDTGRKHQIRVQMAAMGLPILGDVKYGSSQACPRGIALHCYSYKLQHPTLRTPIRFCSEPNHWCWALGESTYEELRRLIPTHLNQDQQELM
jgi:23S rRNA pseudouridine1911/1915/1917 synthase